MRVSDRVYRTLSFQRADAEALRLQGRWNDFDSTRLREAISSSSALPRTFPPIEIAFGESKVQVEDLRGADLSGLVVGDYDLAYCALDYAKFEHSRLVGTRLQYSRLVGASFRSATLDAIQGSPVDAENADFSYARLVDSFFSHSNFDGALSDSAEIRNCDFTECSSPPKAHDSKHSKFVYATSNNQAVVRRVVEYLKADNMSSVSISRKRGVTKIGTVVAGSSPADYVVIVQSKPRQTVGGKVIKKHVEYKISAATTPFSVGDAVRIMSLEVDRRFVPKVAIHKHLVGNRPPTATPKLLKSPSWWIFGRAKSDDVGGLEAAEV